MKMVSLNNGHHWVDAEETMQAVADGEWTFEEVLMMMDDDTRNQVHDELAPCTELEFLTRYLEIAPHDLILG